MPPKAKKTAKPRMAAAPKAAAGGAKPKFGSAQWNAKYGVKKFAKKAKGK